MIAAVALCTCSAEDFRRYPLDAPLSADGLRAAQELATTLWSQCHTEDPVVVVPGTRC